VVRLPLYAEAMHGAQAEQRYHGRRAARTHQEGVRRKVRRAAEHVALAGNQRASEGGVEIALLKQLPGEDLLHGVAMFGVEAIGQRQLHFVRVREQILLIKPDEAVEIRPDAVDIAVGGARLDYVLQLVAEDRLLVEHASQRWKNDVERQIAGAAH